MITARLLAVSAVFLVTAACDERESRDQTAPAQTTRTISQSDVYPGASASPPPTSSQYDESPYAISEGKRLFSWFNCSGCHSHGGGGMGPPLMDATWIYGSEPNNIFATIVEGRPNGMPSFGGKIPDQQIWQLVAYVRSLSGLVPKTAATPRDDHLNAKRPESEQDLQPPESATTPPSAEMPTK
jgi:cytochrome c oxidase cbb3-type subunit 3